MVELCPETECCEPGARDTAGGFCAVNNVVFLIRLKVKAYVKCVVVIDL